jgi:hypothetical protein
MDDVAATSVPISARATHTLEYVKLIMTMPTTVPQLRHWGSFA